MEFSPGANGVSGLGEFSLLLRGTVSEVIFFFFVDINLMVMNLTNYKAYSLCFLPIAMDEPKVTRQLEKAKPLARWIAPSEDVKWVRGEHLIERHYS